MAILDDLLDAKKKIEAGWTQGAFTSTLPHRSTRVALAPWEGRPGETVVAFLVVPNSEVGEYKCSLGALGAASETVSLTLDGVFAGEVRDHTAQRLVRSLVQERGYRSISAWNDTPGRTQEEVVSLFQEAIDIVTSGERG